MADGAGVGSGTMPTMVRPAVTPASPKNPAARSRVPATALDAAAGHFLRRPALRRNAQTTTVATPMQRTAVASHLLTIALTMNRLMNASTLRTRPPAVDENK